MYRLGDERLKSSPMERDVGILVYSKLHIKQWCALVAKRDNHILGRIASQLGEVIVPLLCAGVSLTWVLCVVLGTTIYQGYKTIREHKKEGNKDGEVSRRQHEVCLSSLSLLSLEKTERGSHSSLELPHEVEQRRHSGAFSSLWWPSIGPEGMEWSYGRFRLNIRKRLHQEGGQTLRGSGHNTRLSGVQEAFGQWTQAYSLDSRQSQELDSVIPVCPFQLRIFYDSMTWKPATL